MRATGKPLSVIRISAKRAFIGLSKAQVQQLAKHYQWAYESAWNLFKLLQACITSALAGHDPVTDEDVVNTIRTWRVIRAGTNVHGLNEEDDALWHLICTICHVRNGKMKM